MKKLSIQYFSQWDSDAGNSNNDCSPTSLKMVLNYYGKLVAVNDLLKASGAGTGFVNWTQLSKSAKAYGFTSSMIRKANKKSVMELIDQGYPCIVVLHYGDLPNRQDVKFTGPHILVISGYDESGYFVHDPNYKGDRRNEGAYKHYDNAVFEKAWGSEVDKNQPFSIFFVDPPAGWNGGVGESISPDKQLPASFRGVGEFKKLEDMGLAKQSDAFDTLLSRLIDCVLELKSALSDALKYEEDLNKFKKKEYQEALDEVEKYKKLYTTALENVGQTGEVVAKEIYDKDTQLLNKEIDRLKMQKFNTHEAVMFFIKSFF